eukprot:3942375-Amphidinium_carterae.3
MHMSIIRTADAIAPRCGELCNYQVPVNIEFHPPANQALHSSPLMGIFRPLACRFCRAWLSLRMPL